MNDKNAVRRVNIGLSISLLTLLIISYFAYDSITEMSVYIKNQSITSKLIRDFIQVRSILKDAQRGERGYVITGDARFLKPFNEAKDSLEDLLLKVENDESDSVLDEKIIDKKFQNEVKNLLTLYTTIINARRENGFEEAAKIVMKGDGNDILIELHDRIDKYISQNQYNLITLVNLYEESKQKTIISVIIGGLLSIFIIVYISIKLNKDIKLRTAVENELRESEFRFKTLVNETASIVWLTDAQGKINEYLPSWESFTGQSFEEMKGFGWLNAIHPDDMESVNEIWNKSVQNKSFYQAECRLKNSKGNYRYIIAKGTPIIDINGNVKEWIGTNTDIHDRKMWEEKLSDLNNELNKMVKERTEELETANKELEGFSYSVSHDLRAPLRAVSGFCEILSDEYGKKLDDEGKRIIGIITHNTQKMGTLIDDLLKFSRISRQQLNYTLIDTQKLVNNVINDIGLYYKLDKVRFEFGDLIPIYADLKMMEQVFNNLISNSIKYTRYKPEPIIRIGSSGKNGDVTFFIKDNGAGFDMKFADKLFGVFQRLHSEKEFEGTGIGLALVSRIITKHEGKVWAEAEVNNGATFYFTLPNHKEKS